MKFGPFQYKNVGAGEDPSDLFRSVRDIVDQINKSSLASDNLLRFSAVHTTEYPMCSASTTVDEFPFYIVPKERSKVLVERIVLSPALAAGADITVRVKRRTGDSTLELGTYSTTTNGTIAAYGVGLFVLASTERLIMVPDDKITLTITCGANALSAGVLQVNMQEVFP